MYSIFLSMNRVARINWRFAPGVYKWLIKTWSYKLWSIRPKFWCGLKRLYHVSLYQIWNYLDQWQQSYGRKYLENFYYVMWENSQHGCCNINVWRFFKLWTAVTLEFISISTWNLQRLFKAGLITSRQTFVKKVVNFLMISLQTKNRGVLKKAQRYWKSFCSLLNCPEIFM